MALYELTEQQKQNKLIDRIIACGRVVGKSRAHITFQWGQASVALYPSGLRGSVKLPTIAIPRKPIKIIEVTNHWDRHDRYSPACGASARVCKLSNGEYAVVDTDSGESIWGNNDCLVKNIIGPHHRSEEKAVDAMTIWCNEE